MEKLEYSIKKLIVDQTKSDMNPEDISDDDYLIGGKFNLDSIILIELIVAMEQKFDIVFDDEDLTKELFSSVSFIADYIRQKKNER